LSTPVTIGVYLKKPPGSQKGIFKKLRVLCEDLRALGGKFFRESRRIKLSYAKLGQNASFV
jgi:hypothetical protein